MLKSTCRLDEDLPYISWTSNMNGTLYFTIHIQSSTYKFGIKCILVIGVCTCSINNICYAILPLQKWKWMVHAMNIAMQFTVQNLNCVQVAATGRWGGGGEGSRNGFLRSNPCAFCLSRKLGNMVREKSRIHKWPFSLVTPLTTCYLILMTY